MIIRIMTMIPAGQLVDQKEPQLLQWPVFCESWLKVEKWSREMTVSFSVAAGKQDFATPRVPHSQIFHDQQVNFIHSIDVIINPGLLTWFKHSNSQAFNNH